MARQTLTATMGAGSVFVLKPPAAPGEAWAQTVLYSFGAAGDGAYPPSGVVLGPNGTLYGTTAGGGANGFGTIYRMDPPKAAGGSWTETVLYSFTDGSDAAYPADLIADGRGALYGSTSNYPTSGTLFHFTP